MVGILIATGLLDRDPTPTPVVERVAEPTDGGAALGTAALPVVVRIESNRPDGLIVGAGVFIRSDGHVLTTSTIAESADTVDVYLADGSKLDGVVVGHDPLTDVGVIRIEVGEVDPILLGSAGDLESGEQILAVSAPDAGPSARITEGVVTAVGVTIADADLQPLHAMIGTSEAFGGLDPGTAVLDQRGALVAIVSGRDGDPTDGSESDGDPTDGRGPYATPVETARIVAADIIDTGEARHPWLGVGVRPADDGSGPVVSTIAIDSPAHGVGLREGDLITTVGGSPVDSVGDLVTELRLHHPGDSVTIEYVREGHERNCQPALEEWRPDQD